MPFESRIGFISSQALSDWKTCTSYTVQKTRLFIGLKTVMPLLWPDSQYQDYLEVYKSRRSPWETTPSARSGSKRPGWPSSGIEDASNGLNWPPIGLDSASPSCNFDIIWIGVFAACSRYLFKATKWSSLIFFTSGVSSGVMVPFE